MNHWVARGTIFYAVVVAVAARRSGRLRHWRADINRAQFQAEIVSAIRLGEIEPARRMKSCSTFGAGFVQIPGTDTCVKIGGYVTTEGTVNHAR